MALTLCSEQDIKDEAGAGASSSIIASSAWIVRLGERAEKEVVAITRRDWINDYSDIDTATKDLVKQAVVAKAAKAIVKYDFAGFFSRSEQEMILDVLDDNYRIAIDALNKLDANKIRGVNE